MSGATTVVLATGGAPGAVAVVEVRGPAAATDLVRLAQRPLPGPGAIVLTALLDGDELLDEALLVGRDGGFDVCLHGSPAVVRRVLALLARDAASPSHAADWSAVARARLAKVLSDAGARILLDQSQGALDRALADLATAPDAARRASELAALGRAAAPFLVPPRVVLAGPVNAGKSTLFNAVVGRERVLASPVPGTTRDAVRESVRDGDFVFELVDTAGERDLAQAESARLEGLGQERARAEAASSDLVLWCRPADGSADSRDAGAGARPDARAARVATLVTCGDRAPAPAGSDWVAAARDPLGARRVVVALVRRALAVAPEPWIPGRAVPIDASAVAALAEAARAGDAAVRAAAACGAFAPGG